MKKDSATARVNHIKHARALPYRIDSHDETRRSDGRGVEENSTLPPQLIISSGVRHRFEVSGNQKFPEHRRALPVAQLDCSLQPPFSLCKIPFGNLADQPLIDVVVRITEEDHARLTEGRHVVKVCCEFSCGV